MIEEDNHKFLILSDLPYIQGDETHAKKVVLWCTECGAIRVDLKVGKEVTTGFFNTLRYPLLTKQLNKIKDEHQKKN